jgi:hypothetical protein
LKNDDGGGGGGGGDDDDDDDDDEFRDEPLPLGQGSFVSSFAI